MTRAIQQSLFPASGAHASIFDFVQGIIHPASVFELAFGMGSARKQCEMRFERLFGAGVAAGREGQGGNEDKAPI